MVQGKYQQKPEFPYTLGTEFSGTIVKIYSEKDCKFKIGDKVFGV